MQQTGKLVQWDTAKGYGFITPDAGGPKLFVHIKAFGPRAAPPVVGELVSFDIGADAQGKARALNVCSTAAAKPSPAEPQHYRNSQLWLVPVFAALYLFVQVRWPLPPFVWGTYMAMSLATFIVYFGDKRAARLGRDRVSEATMHGLALACGWPGALLAQQLLRHKSVKPRFQRLFWLSVLANVLVFVLLATPMVELLRKRSAATPASANIARAGVPGSGTVPPPESARVQAFDSELPSSVTAALSASARPQPIPALVFSVML